MKREQTIRLIVGGLEGFLRDHERGEFEWNEVVNVFGPESAQYFLRCSKELDDIKSYTTETEAENNRLRSELERLRDKTNKSREIVEQIESWTRNPRQYEPSLYSINHLAREALVLSDDE